MFTAIVIIVIAAVILLLLLILQRHEIKNISRQINEIKSRDTNELIHTSGSDKTSGELINEINSLLREMRDRKIQYQKKSHALEQMMTNISHDLRTPLTSAMGYIGIIKNSDISPEEKEREIEIIEKRLIRLEELINSFFEFSKIISSDTPPELSELNLNAILEESIVHYYDDYCGQNREIILNCEASKIKLLSNRNMLMRIFDNLIGNALKHGTGDLTISVQKSENILIHFENELTDSEIDTDRIFEEFYTTDISRTKGNTGLGLAIAKQFTNMLDGKISAIREKNILRITVELPAGNKI
ncbi:MAG: HAMP domain-containing histidine kinase [Oscillospiraceae bacterium]|nr:HAMP domain-containing histidine kinase [Oscillospiraceae bacterium]